MTVCVTLTISNGHLMVQGEVVLTRVPANVVCSPAPQGSALVGARLNSPSSYHVFNLGVLEGYKLMCIYRFKVWWMIPSFRKSGSDVPAETQLLFLEAKEENHDNASVSEPYNENTFYILFLPVLEGKFRTSLQGTSANELQLCVESGDPDLQTSQLSEALFLYSGRNPYELMKNSIKILEQLKGTLNHIDNKKVPPHLDWFGWCTWDAFYTKVTPQGIREELKRQFDLTEGGCPPKFLIIDDGWQETCNEFLKEDEAPHDMLEFATRLVDIKENRKFKRLESGNPFDDLHQFIQATKDNYGLKFVYIWHALLGYWGGLDPSSEAMKKHCPKLKFPVLSPGNKTHIRCGEMESLVKFGVGIIDPSKLYDFYNDMHGYLRSCGADGVKVDIQNVVETLASDHGGRVELMRKYQEALEESVARNFTDNNVIASMNRCTDCFYSLKKCAIARASEDYMPHRPTLQASHIASVAFNSFFIGEIVSPDWDVFQSDHFTAEFHSAARAVGGCAVYVSDKPGKHDFKIIKRLVLPDGAVLRARFPGRPTRDCLLNDLLLDAKSLLKIWNLNKFSGIIGVFNCQGAGNWPSEVGVNDVPFGTSAPPSISGHVSPGDVEHLEGIADKNWSGDCAVYTFFSGETSGSLDSFRQGHIQFQVHLLKKYNLFYTFACSLTSLPKKGKVKVTLETLHYEVFTISPVKVFDHNLQFAPIGLLDMYNSGGAIEALNYSKDISGCEVKVQARGCGRFGAYSSIKPRSCNIDLTEEEFIYNADDGLLTFNLEGGCNLKEIDIVFN